MMNFLTQLRSGSSHSSVHSRRNQSARSGAYSHRSAKESVGRRVHADGMSMSRNYDGSSSSRVGVGTVLVMLRESVDGPQPPPLRVFNKDSKLIPKDYFFQAVIAPDNDQALAFLAVQPAGTYVLVKETADDIAVYVKFQAAVRSFTVIKGKDIKRVKPTDDLVEWGRAYRPLAVNTPHAEALLSQSTQMTPIHRLYLPNAEYYHLEKCWLHFFPQVQAIAFELCTQPYYMDEEMLMEEWDRFILASRVPCIAFVSVDSCGFHLFNTSAIAAAAAAETSTLGASLAATAAAAVSVPVRIVEFDISKCLISIADGVFRPNSLVAPVHFGPTKLYDAELSFAAIRENFLAPERVALKEASGAATSTAGVGVGAAGGVATTATSSPWHDLGPHVAGGDAELLHLLAVRSVVAALVPHEPLPEGFLDELVKLHTHWASLTRAQCRSRWRTPAKIKCVAMILPFYVELFLATATTDPYVLQLFHGSNRPDYLPRMAAALRHDLLFMARRTDDASVARLVHHVLQALALRASVPAQLVSLISDLCIESAHFRILFMRNQGASLLWKAIHTAMSPLDDISLPLLLQTQLQQPRAAPLMSEITKRRSSLFGGRRKSQQARGGSRKSLAFNASIVMPVTFETTVQVFFRLNPLLVQLELAPLLRDHHFAEAVATRVSASTDESSLHPMGSTKPVTRQSASSVPHTGPAVASPMSEMVLFIERLAFLFMADPTSPTWEKDVLQLLRMDELYERLYHELMSCAPSVTSASLADETAEERHRMETILECIAALYRLETKRRRHAGPNIGEKKYWFLFHLLRNPVRAFHERMKEQVHALANPTEPSSQRDSDQVSEDSSGHAIDLVGFSVLARVLPRLPRQMVTEFVLVSLDDVLQATRILHEYIQRRPHGHGLTRHVRLLVTILTVVLRRTSDFDLQLMLARVLASSGSTLPAMLQLLVRESTKHGDVKYAVELELLDFAEAFVALAISLTQLEKWHAAHESLYATLENKEDVEGNEQRKTMLMATVLSPENGVADSDEILWDSIQDILLPAALLDSTGERRARLGVVESFYSKAVFTQWDTKSARPKDEAKLRAMKLYLRMRTRVFLSPILENPRLTSTQLREFVELHWNYLYDLREQYKGLGPCTDDSDRDSAALRDECRVLVLLHLRCLTALASRRVVLPALDEAFLDFRTSRELFRILQLGTSTRHHRDSKMDDVSGRTSLSLNLGKMDHIGGGGTTVLSTSELLLSAPMLHAATLLTILASILGEPHTLNDRVVPRFFIPSSIEGSSLNLLPDEDLLLGLQRHLRCVDSPTLRAALQASLQEAELDQHFGSPARAHAVRVLVRLLLPDSYDAHLYTRSAAPVSSTSINEHGMTNTLEDGLSDDEEETDTLPTASHPRTYVAKGAFATVFRATPSVPDTGASEVAIKVCGHQRSSGELCVAAEVFNEVVVLERLHGNLAATQLIDYGNNTKESLGFELVMEHCPATLTQWRRSLDPDSAVEGTTRTPFRSLLSLSLGVFIEVARAVAQIHADHVCHFDIKADNVLLRVEPSILTAELLRAQTGKPKTEATSTPRVCLGDFGESCVMPADGRELQLTRTRGTEAIKSPEMLSVTGGVPTIPTSNTVGPASDVWSLGCLLYELLTGDVMFANDDWAQLFAHLVAPASSSVPAPPVVRDDHKQKLLRVLAPKTDAEKGLAVIFIQFLDMILQRDLRARPSLTKVLDEAETQRRMILALPSQAEDDAFQTAALAKCSDPAVPSTNSSATVAPTTADPGAALAHLRKPLYKDHGPLAGRVFFNLYLARDARVLHEAAFQLSPLGVATAMTTDAATPEPSPRREEMPPTTLLHDALLRQELSASQLALEPQFGHFIYFCYDDVKRQVSLGGHSEADGDALASETSPGSGDTGRAAVDSGPFLEIVEGVGRTVFYFSRARVLACLRPDQPTPGGGNGGPGRAASSVSSLTSARGGHTSTAAPATGDAAPTLTRLLLQHSRGILAALQRHLRHQSSRVLLVPADYDELAVHAASTSNVDGSPLAELTTATLLFVLMTGLGLTPLQALASFSRECQPLVPLPSTHVLTQLLRLHEELVTCGLAVVTTERAVHNRVSVRCRCGDKVLAVATSALGRHDGLRFAPPTVDVDVDAEVVWNPRETRLVLQAAPTSSTASPLWTVVDMLAVERLDSLLRTVLRRQVAGTAPSGGVATSTRGGHRRSIGHIPPRYLSNHTAATPDDVAAALRDHAPFVLHGLTETPSGDATWTLYECGLCGTHVCATTPGADRLALPL